MTFLGNLINEFTHKGQGSEQQQQQQGGSYGYDYQQQHQNYGQPQQQQQQQQGGPPQVYPPWQAVWDDRDNRWLYINDQNGERTFEHPSHSAGYGNSGYGQGGGYSQGPPPPSQQQYYGQQQQQQPEKKSGGHGLAYGAMGAVAGLAGGALLMHEGEEIKDDWKRDEYRAEERLDEFGNRIEDAPEDIARWTGEKVQDVEDIPQDIEQGWDRTTDRIENGWDNAVDRVEDFPENVAEDIGEGVGDVERFGDRIDDAYDEGRQEGRDEDGW